MVIRQPHWKPREKAPQAMGLVRPDQRAVAIDELANHVLESTVTE
jgi:hypothetical protein